MALIPSTFGMPMCCLMWMYDRSLKRGRIWEYLLILGCPKTHGAALRVVNQHPTPSGVKLAFIYLY